MDLVPLSDALLSHLTDLVPYVQFVAAAAWGGGRGTPGRPRGPPCG